MSALGLAFAKRRGRQPLTPKDDSELAQKVGANVEAGDTDPDTVSLLEHSPVPDAGPPSWLPHNQPEDQATWERAVAAVAPDGAGGERYADPWLVVVHVYMAMGGEVSDESADPVDAHQSDEA